MVQLVGHDKRYFIFRVETGGKLHSNRGVVEHDQLIGREWGSEVFSHLHHPFFLLIPSTDDLIRDIKRSSQIMYPKDIGFILTTMSIGPGQTVMEAGTGSGSMTVALAFCVGAQGRVITYERRPEFQELARKNLSRLGLDGQVEFKLGDIAEGISETNVDAFFLDVPNPWDYIWQVRAALKPGGFFCNLVPTFNQVETLLHALRHNDFAFLEVCEILLRYYKPEPSRLRPTDRMVAHTGFLTFARRIEPAEDERGSELMEELHGGKDDHTPE